MKKKYLILTIITLLIVAISLLIYRYGITYAKYLSSSVKDYYLESKGFYFNSDYLSVENTKNVDNLWDGGSVYFNLKNNLNESVVTSYDINYTIACDIEGEVGTYATCHLNGTTSDTENGILSNYQICINNTEDQVDVSLYTKAECELGGYTWMVEPVSKDLYFDIILTDENYELSDLVVDITATSTSPYSKTLLGTFSLHKVNIEEGKVNLDYKNYSSYDSLIVSNSYSSTKCVNISWDSNKLIIDANLNEFSSYGKDSNGYINSIKFNVDSKKSLNYTFYKKNINETYDSSQFSLEETEGC